MYCKMYKRGRHTGLAALAQCPGTLSSVEAASRRRRTDGNWGIVPRFFLTAPQSRTLAYFLPGPLEYRTMLLSVPC